MAVGLILRCGTYTVGKRINKPFSRLLQNFEKVVVISNVNLKTYGSKTLKFKLRTCVFILFCNRCSKTLRNQFERQSVQ